MNQQEKLTEATILALQNKLIESNNELIGYRTIGVYEFFDLLDNEIIEGQFDIFNGKQEFENIICFFNDKLMWKKKDHEILIKCKFNNKDILGSGKGEYWATKDIKQRGIMTGRRGNTQYFLDEFYVKEYSLKNVLGFYGGPNETIADYLEEAFNRDYSKKYKERLVELGYDINDLP